MSVALVAFDDDRVPSRRFRLSDFRTTIASVVTTPDLRNLGFACFAFNGIQSVLIVFEPYLKRFVETNPTPAPGLLLELLVSVAGAAL